ncbi:bifunctional diaminohydroxyphosphoribosylaminopyrimidine deaminase/5-amino-6-(5-phosphoribosylamino)uracil reductase RibD [Paenibacillus alvei]|uniref:bifunctional diaminohydroxyphosphoribosylaminopyrimidine deaminase/5-amino-6-(5-phosphoribosylamino)uracil reductase RibD n=1 Tax=Paenibacillus alvei TaxID=44250 RepID=UPI0013DC51BA|nr:bifunctional diaminohydroxyphosphoribosylaminopyrimidine deaminase/5-amino-6-(5-phosphoribosylamino)uracil reductase RibD [Paenibacillus alvei]MBG9736090.1 5-amino-6-(5-phosphoribosylamino)uracil reductase [Paenibacillus alvei]MBG9743391.1 5-amino-6-(5-phosphoribosylamino)uracil reductase [Paenibacillus alvei]MCY9579331.1 bifunctional diaminohydroxyphosphoribosylaminopyrimidine deaminase/5-amino-6-(5-phosphoribosylamino)uracil reductase RibD [Paenibacillus alvei]MCY9585981.1 bifunctional dia
MSTVINDELYMQLALDMAERVLGQTDVNPAVGCVIVKEGRVVGLGAHLRRGEGHAEVHALAMAGEAAQGATAYVTLEPCSHYGRTPPCSLRLIESGVARVVIACVDPNPAVAGKGIALLKQHGIEVTVDVLREQGLALIEMFAKYITTGLPFVTLKTASTLDGKIATASGDSKWISNEQCREVVHTMRHRHQAIMVGIGTVLADNPSLTTRLTVPGVSPIRLIVDSKLRIPVEAKVVTDRSVRTCIFTTALASEQKRRELESRGVDVVACGEGEQVNLHQMMEWCGQHDIGSILLEGGGHLNGAMLKEKLIDKIVLFIAPLIVGGQQAPGNFAFGGVSRMKDAYHLQHMEVEVLGDNVCISGYPFGKRQVEQAKNGMKEDDDDVHRAR